LKHRKHRGFISKFNKSVNVDTRSVSAQIALETTNIAECNVVMFAEVTSELRVGQGRSLEIIQ